MKKRVNMLFIKNKNKFKQELAVVDIDNRLHTELTGTAIPITDLRLMHIGVLISCAASTRSNAAGRQEFVVQKSIQDFPVRMPAMMASRIHFRLIKALKINFTILIFKPCLITF